MLTVGNRLVVQAIDLDYLGQGVVKHEGYVIFVPHFLMGETAEIVIVKIKNQYAEGKVVKRLTDSSERISHPDEIYGGADLLHLSHQEQCKWQRRITAETLKKIGGIEVAIDETVTDSKATHYRNKSVFHVMDSPMLKLGLYAFDNSKLIQAKTYVLADERTNTILSFLYDHPVIIDPKSFSHLIIRTNPKGEALVTLVTIKPLFKGQNDLVERLKSLDFVIGITLNIRDNPRHIIGRHSMVLYGENLITEPLGHQMVQITDRSFFQVNLPVSMMAYDIIKREMIHDGVVIDAYSGIGSIGFHIADIASKVIMIESNRESVEMANRIKEVNHFNHVDVICDQAEVVMKHLNSDVIITDPPRNGLMPEMIEQILQSHASQMFYLSCDVKTLARDLKMLTPTFEIKKVIPIRMFPQTTEMETLVILKRSV
jgi:23S rRNA (uracil1939-C5)-methyltransferase